MKKQKDDILTIETVADFCDFFGCPASSHPLFTICRVSDIADYSHADTPVRLNLYSIVMKDGSTCSATYGWRKYDFSKGALNFYAPGQIHQWNATPADTTRWGWIITFHTDFLNRYSLGENIGKYNFFSYNTNEALHISDAERKVLEQIMTNIETEAFGNMDGSTQEIIVSQLEVLLKYSRRYYNRQFMTRSSVEDDVVSRFRYIIEDSLQAEYPTIPEVSVIATKMNMSPHYLSDTLRSLTGETARQLIQSILIDKAKLLLGTTQMNVNEIAYSLGFEYPQYFSRLFKIKTGVTPVEFRYQN